MAAKLAREEMAERSEHERQLRDLARDHYEVLQLATTLQRAGARVANALAEGDRIQGERTIFRQRAAALIQGYRTKDLTFRTVRNEGYLFTAAVTLR